MRCFWLSIVTLIYCISANQLFARALDLKNYITDPEELDALPKPSSKYYQLLRSNVLKCIGPAQKWDKAEVLSIAGQNFLFDGISLIREAKDKDGLVLGVLGAVKDYSKETQKALDFYLERFVAQKVDALVLNGDLAASEFETTQVMLHCAQYGWPVLVLIGNTEGRSAFNRAVLAASKVASNIVHLGFVRRVVWGQTTLLSLPGYMDRKFVYQSGGCAYKKKDITNLIQMAKMSSGPVVLISHGPPAGTNAQALDVAVEAGNVGDDQLTQMIKEKLVQFGLFGHILEAGGRLIDNQGKPVAEGSWVPYLYANVGSANPLPWQLNNGKVSCGMAALMTIKGDKAKLKFLHNRCN